MLLSHTPTGAAAPDLVFCARLPLGQCHQPATRVGTAHICPRPCGPICPLQVGACTTPPPALRRLALSLGLNKAVFTPPALGCVIFRN